MGIFGDEIYVFNCPRGIQNLEPLKTPNISDWILDLPLSPLGKHLFSFAFARANIRQIYLLVNIYR